MHPTRPRPRVTDRGSGQEAQHFPALLVDAQDPGRVAHPAVREMAQQSVHRRRPWLSRPAHRALDQHRAARVPTRQRLLHTPTVSNSPSRSPTRGSQVIVRRRPVMCKAMSDIGDTSAVTDMIAYAWRGPVADEEIIDLERSDGRSASIGRWNQISAHSLGWVSGNNRDGLLVGFVNIAWDGGDHAFLIDTRTRRSFQHRGIGSELVRLAVVNARAAGCEWIHVDFEPNLAPFYFDACRFRRTDAGLIHLPSATRTE